MSLSDKLFKKIKVEIKAGQMNNADALLDAWLMTGKSITEHEDYGSDPICVSLLKMGVDGQRMLWKCLDRHDISPLGMVSDDGKTLLHVAAGLKEKIAMPFLEEWKRRELGAKTETSRACSPIGM